MNQVTTAQPLHKPPRVDGRRLRSERTKQLIIEAFISLLRDASVMPTAVQIAERAGYSVRSIFERFPDLVAVVPVAMKREIFRLMTTPTGTDLKVTGVGVAWPSCQNGMTVTSPETPT